jgi:hypothetical protein
MSEEENPFEQGDLAPRFKTSYDFVDFFRANHAILDENHNVIPVRSWREWAGWSEEAYKAGNAGPRRVAETTVNGWWVSTVFLGINHGFSGPPLWFETMVFEDEDSPPPPEIEGKLHSFLKELQLRYVTWTEATEGHATIVEMIRRGLF